MSRIHEWAAARSRRRRASRVDAAARVAAEAIDIRLVSGWTAPLGANVFEKESSSDETRRADEGYAYPGDLARFVRERWSDDPERLGSDQPSPDAATLKHFLSACYQASLLREEERPVTFRAVLAPPAFFPDDGIPPESLAAA